MNTAAPKNTDEYLKVFPPDVRKNLEQLRQTIKAAAPDAEELISYGMPAYKYNGILVYFAGYKNHIGFYPTAGAIKKFKKELSAYKLSKGTIRFPVDKPLPPGLISKIVKFRVKQNDAKPGAKKKTITTLSKTKRSAKPADEEQVKVWMERLDTSVRKEIDAVRKIIKNAHPKLKERIKWNAPSFYITEDILTFGPYKKDKILLVFHHPSVVKIRSPLLEGDYKDRRLVWFKNKAEAQKNKVELIRIINEIIKMTGNK